MARAYYYSLRSILSSSSLNLVSSRESDSRIFFGVTSLSLLSNDSSTASSLSCVFESAECSLPRFQKKAAIGVPSKGFDVLTSFLQGGSHSFYSSLPSNDAYRLSQTISSLQLS